MINVENMEYNTTRNHLTMKEYGRHIQKMVEYTLTIEDQEKRQKNANAVIELMGILNPHLKNVEDFRHKLWDHIFLISDFKLDIESPYPIPTREELQAKPDPLPYPKRHPKYNHLGKNIEVVIDKALKEENPEKKQGFANAIAYYMKLTYSNWHNELMHDDSIQGELSKMTKGELEFNNKPFVKHRTDNRVDRDDYGTAGRNQFRKNFGPRDNRNAGTGGRDNRIGGTGMVQGNRNNTGSANNRNNNNNNNSNNNNNNNNNNKNFKKRF